MIEVTTTVVVGSAVLLLLLLLLENAALAWVKSCAVSMGAGTLLLLDVAELLLLLLPPLLRTAGALLLRAGSWLLVRRGVGAAVLLGYKSSPHTSRHFTYLPRSNVFQMSCDRQRGCVPLRGAHRGAWTHGGAGALDCDFGFEPQGLGQADELGRAVDVGRARVEDQRAGARDGSGEGDRVRSSDCGCDDDYLPHFLVPLALHGPAV